MMYSAKPGYSQFLRMTTRRVSAMLLMLWGMVAMAWGQSTPNQNGEYPTVGKIYKIRSIVVYQQGNNRRVRSERYLRASNFENTDKSMTGVLKSEAPDFSTLRGDEVNRYYWVLRQNSKGEYYFTNYGGKGYLGYAVGVAYDSNGNITSTSSPNTMGCTVNTDEIFYFDSFDAVNRKYRTDKGGSDKDGTTAAGALLEGYALKFKFRNDKKEFDGSSRYVWMNENGDVNYGGPLTTSFNNGSSHWSSAFVFEPVNITDFDVTFTRSDNGKAEAEGEGYNYFTTFYWPFPVTIPDDVKVWQIKNKGTGEVNTELTLETPPTEEFWYDGQRIIPERTAVLLSVDGSESDANVTLTRKFSIYLTNEIAPITTTGFTGSLIDVPIEGYKWQEMEHPNVYVLGKRNGRVAFYWLKDTHSSANKCYFKLDNPGNAKEMAVMRFSNETVGIGSVVSTDSDDAPVYDLQGRRVTPSKRGIYIKNGKKFVVR